MVVSCQIWRVETVCYVMVLSARQYVPTSVLTTKDGIDTLCRNSAGGRGRNDEKAPRAVLKQQLDQVKYPMGGGYNAAKRLLKSHRNWQGLKIAS
jgi:hypothetical protein